MINNNKILTLIYSFYVFCAVGWCLNVYKLGHIESEHIPNALETVRLIGIIYWQLGAALGYIIW